MVAFAGAGEVARDLMTFDLENLLPSAGAGVRYMVSEKERVNISIDQARAQAGEAIYFSTGRNPGRS